MADAKSKKTNSAKKIIDVKSEGDAASGTSRPIIVNNGPMVKDPMMAEVSQLTGGLDTSDIETSAAAPDKTDETSKSAPAGGAPEIIKQKKTPIKIDSHDEELEAAKNKDASAPSEDTPVVAPSKKKLVIKPLGTGSDEKAAAPPDTAAQEPAAIEEPEPEKSVASEEKPITSSETKAQPAAPDSTSPKEQLAKSSESKEKTEPEKVPETPVSEEIITEEQPTTEDATTDTADKEAAPATEADAEDKAEPEEGSLTPELAADAKDKPEKKTKKSGELTSEQQKAVESGEYFLPITTAETRRLRREIVFTTIFVTILIVVWLDIMLDADLLQIGNLKAVTHFF